MIPCSSVRVWRQGGGCDVLEAHKPAVWAVAGLHAVDGTKRILTGGWGMRVVSRKGAVSVVSGWCHIRVMLCVVCVGGVTLGLYCVCRWCHIMYV